jgi:hypothetical protein
MSFVQIGELAKSTAHSFLFALVTHALVLSANLQVLPLSIGQTARSAGWLVVSNGVLLAVLSFWRTPQAAAATLSWFYIALSFYFGALSVVHRVAPAMAETSWAAAYVAMCVAIAVWLGRPPRDRDERHKLFTLAALTLLMVSVGMSALRVSPLSRSRWEPAVAAVLAAAPKPIHPPADLPDIYYVVLDGFGRPDVLSARFAVDAKQSLDVLRETGWTVTRSSVTNYTQTYLAIASALNGAYLNPVATVMGDSRDRRPLHELIQRSAPIAALKKQGYSFRMIGSNTSVTASHRQADSCHCQWPGLNEFENSLLAMTPFRMLPLHRPTYGGQYRAVVDAFHELEHPAAAKGPVLVFAHIIAPHPPFVVDEQGHPTGLVGPVTYQDGDQFPGTIEEYQRGYQAQARYVFSRLSSFARTIASRGRPAIAIVHGDHGPGAHYSHRSLEQADLSERLPIFMAVRLAGGAAVVPDDLTPVNVFRLIFNTDFGARDPLLPNRSYYATWDAPYRLTEVR